MEMVYLKILLTLKALNSFCELLIHVFIPVKTEHCQLDLMLNSFLNVTSVLISARVVFLFFSKFYFES